jgi:uncharacterized protein (TIGR03083 family)
VNTPSQVKVARATTELLRDELAALTAAEWEAPNACGVLSVSETVAHLARGAERYTQWTRRALEGVADPPDDAVFYATRATGSAGIRDGSLAYHRSLGARILEAFEKNGLALIELFESLKPDDWQRPTFHPVAVIPIEKLLGWRIAELSLHRWDILDRLGREAHLPDGSHEPIVDWLPVWFKIAIAVRDPLERPLHYRFVLSPPLSRAMQITIHGERHEVDGGDTSRADATLTTDSETFILLMMGRLKWEPAIETGAVVGSGTEAAAAELSRWFGAL